MIENVSALSELINSGLALIPVDDNKEPFAPFKGKNKNKLIDLIDAVSYYERERGIEIIRVAARLGNVSSLNGDLSLVCIDVDSKHKEGFSERIYVDFQNLFPEIFSRLRVDRTPSGGLHFYYFVSEGGEICSKNLASRYCTESELELNPKRKTKCFLELKAGDGSLSTIYPSIGYSLIKNVAGEAGFSVLTLEEHLSLTEICYAYNEVQIEQKIRVNKSRESIYLEGKSPFECYNESDSASLLLEDLGWTRWKNYGGYETFKKPGSKKVGATFNPSKRTYAILTTGSEIETACYRASTLLCNEKFDNDASKCYQYLVALGFGVLKPNVEKAEINKALKLGSDLPANISEEGFKKFEEEKLKSNEKYPFGTFWEESIKQDGESEYIISRELIFRVSNSIGFRSYKEKPVLISGYLIKEVDEKFYFDYLKSYIGDFDNIKLLDKYEDFLQKSGTFTIKRLEELDKSMILVSTKKESYKFYKNCYYCITASGLEIFDYLDLKHLIFEKDIKNRNFESISSELDLNVSLYYQFIQNAIGWSDYLMKCIGFYAHDFRDEESYLCNTTEKCEESKDGGGSGKNIFWKLFGQITSFKSTAASMIKKDNQFLQSWNGERVFVMADLPKGFDLIFFKDMITDGAVVRKLYKDEYNVDVSEMAKLGVSTNYSFDDSDPGIKRRLRIIEFNDYYTKNGGVKKVHGKMFPKDWDDLEYIYFDNIMAACIEAYLKAECIIERHEVSETGWSKKMEENYKHLYEFIRNSIDTFNAVGKISNKYFNDLYSNFRIENNITKALTAFSINRALTEYCEHFGIPFLHSYRKPNGEISDGAVWKDNTTTVKGRLFGLEVNKFLNRHPDYEIYGKKSEEIRSSSESDLPF